MKNIISFSILLFHLTSATAQTTEERLATLEKKLDRILELLEQEQEDKETSDDGTNNESIPKVTSEKGKKTTKAAVDKKTQLQNGAALSAYLITADSYPTPQQGKPIVQITDKGTGFRLGNYLATPASKTYEAHHVGVKWQGYIWIDKPGEYTFNSRYLTSGRTICSLSINGQNILQAYGNQRAPALGNIVLTTPGAYHFEVWMASQYDGDNHTSFQIEYGLFGASEFTKVTPGSLYSRVQKK